jgi:hypothetical protein
MSLSSADDRASNWALGIGAAVTATIAFVVGANDGSVSSALIAGSTGGLTTGFWLRKTMKPGNALVRRLGPGKRTLSTVQELVDARHQFAQSRDGHAQSLKAKHDLRRRLVSLRDKMVELGLPAYRARIAIIDAALATLDQQIAVYTRLRDGYDRNIKMIEIELESGAAAEKFDEDISAAIAAAVSELDVLEVSQRELGRQLEANVEVEELLRRR